MKKQTDTFHCTKKDVMEIALYQAVRHEGFAGEAQNVIEFIKAQNETFGYESFMCKIIPNFKSGKLHDSVDRFIRPFMICMKKYKQGKDWKLI
jgi:hypothetical protein